VQFSASATAGAAAALRLVTQPSSVAQAGVPFDQQPVVQLVDAGGNPVATSGIQVTAAVASGPGKLSGSSPATDANGRATFTDLEVGEATGSHSLIFAAGGFESVISDPISVGPAETTTSITSDLPDPSLPGENVSVVFGVTSLGGAPSGTVVVTASGGPETCSADASSGGCPIALTVEGDRTLTATFQGSDLFQPSEASTTHTVAPAIPPGSAPASSR
jgi:hypothetical protein